MTDRPTDPIPVEIRELAAAFEEVRLAYVDGDPFREIESRFVLIEHRLDETLDALALLIDPDEAVEAKVRIESRTLLAARATLFARTLDRKADS